VILIGDFYQLPPVIKSRQKKDSTKEEAKFVFESEYWVNAQIITKDLTNFFYRQQSNNQFIEILNKIRVGNVSE
jgi:hypothetical protein